MDQVQKRLGLPREPRPSDYFDLIGRYQYEGAHYVDDWTIWHDSMTVPRRIYHRS